MSAAGELLGGNLPGPNLGHLAQHQISNVVGPMEGQAKEDRAAMERFLRECGR
ncbi:MAG TPA: hypothetical protein VKX25_03055 [Bryobacteraceae bacterium]|nr:hypothetical protein [Bryobacteraceae bacterium]